MATPPCLKRIKKNNFYNCNIILNLSLNFYISFIVSYLHILLGKNKNDKENSGVVLDDNKQEFLEISAEVLSICSRLVAITQDRIKI
jgi:magnesium-transporting ATPase (P-type)